jgi:sigma-B regulation protein RsbU (phosphoserine phosphatase)
MEASVASAKVKAARQDYISSFAELVSMFAATPKEELLASIPHLLVRSFEAARAELWLADESSRSAYLVHSAGQPASHKHDYVGFDDGPIGRIGEAKAFIENVLLNTFGHEYDEFTRRTGLTHICCYPVRSQQGNVIAAIAVYSETSVSDELLGWWKLYADMCALKITDVLVETEQQKQITQLSLLFEATRLLNSTLDLAELLDLILKIARQEVKADRGSVFLVDNANQQLWSIVASGLGDQQEIRIPFGTGAAGRVAQTGETINTEDAYTLPYFEASFDQKFGYRTKALLSLPIKNNKGVTVGVIQLLNKIGATKFTAEDVDFLVKLSGHMAMALQNAQLHRDQLIKQRLEKELALARNIQRSLLPETPPIVPGFQIAVLNEPCFEVGGDYYDFITLGPHALLLVVADVEGKGVSSAMVMSNLQATLRALVMHLHSLEVLSTSLNEMIYLDTKSEKYLSCFLGLVDTKRGGLHYINAGHVPPMLIRADRSGVLQLDEGGTVIGLFPQSEYKRGSVLMKPGDVLVCCTDGILEACNREEEEFGKERLAECIARNQSKSAQGIVDAVLADVNAFAATGKYSDDKVLMILKMNEDGLISDAKIRQAVANERREVPRG